MREEYSFGYSATILVKNEDDAFKIEDRLTELKRTKSNVCAHMSAFHNKRYDGRGYTVTIFDTCSLPIHVGASKLDAIVKWSEMKKKLKNVIDHITEGIDISLD